MLNFSVAQIISLLVVLFVAFPLHELAHALTADYFGDDTPRMMGRLTLNPFAHLDLFGSLMLVLAGFGWAKPVPVNQYALERNSRTAPALVALAGPVTNLLLGLAAGLILASGLVTQPAAANQVIPSLYQVLYIFSLINFVLFFFNLIPLFPLDGEKVAVWLLPPDLGSKLAALRRFSFGPMLVLLLILPRLGVPVTDWLVFTPATWLMNLFL